MTMLEAIAEQEAENSRLDEEDRRAELEAEAAEKQRER